MNEQQPTLSALLDRTRSRIERDTALARLYVEMEFPIRKYVFAHINEISDATEVISETWAVVSEIVLEEHYEDRGIKAEALVVGVARNIIRESYRSKKATQAIETTLDNEAETGSNDPSLSTVEAEALLVELLTDPLEREIMRKILDQDTLTEIAADCDVSYSTIARYYKRALERCRKEFTSQGLN